MKIIERCLSSIIILFFSQTIFAENTDCTVPDGVYPQYISGKFRGICDAYCNAQSCGNTESQDHGQLCDNLKGKLTALSDNAIALNLPPITIPCDEPTGPGYTWGKNNDGQLGNDDAPNSTNIPGPVFDQFSMPFGVEFSAVSTGYEHMCAIGNDNKTYCWGENTYGTLGDGTSGPASPTPVEVILPSGVILIDISARGTDHVCALGNDDKTYCWGRNHHGQLGDGTLGTNRLTPVEVVLPSGVIFTAISAGEDWYHTCALGNDNKAYCWGSNSHGQLGDGTSGTDRRNPVEVVLPSGVIFTAISAGEGHVCALGDDDKAYCWGENNDGEIGDGTSGPDKLTPVEVTLPSGVIFTTIGAGDKDTCALGNDNKAYCWGSNSHGQLGDGTSGTDRLTPVEVVLPSGVIFTALNVGDKHNCALGDNDQAYCWGSNSDGQIGNGTSGPDELIPVVVNGGHKFLDISAGGRHFTAAIVKP